MNKNKTIIGRLESIALPDLAIDDLQVRVDTGAKTSSLHVDNLTKIVKKMARNALSLISILMCIMLIVLLVVLPQ